MRRRIGAAARAAEGVLRNPSFLALCLLPVAAFAQAPALDLDGGRQEAVVSVPDAGRAAAFYQTVGAWTVHFDGAVDASQLSAWGLPEGASAREIVLGNPGDATGYVRVLQFAGVEQQFIRPSARAWEPGAVVSCYDKHMMFQWLSARGQELRRNGKCPLL